MSSESNTGSIGDNNHRFWYKEEEMNSKILLRGRCVHSCWANGFLRGRALQGVGSFKKHLKEEKKKIDARSTCMSVPPPPASAADEMIPAEPPRPLAVPVSALPPASATGCSISAGPQDAERGRCKHAERRRYCTLAAGFQAGQQMANLAVLGAVSAPGSPGAVAPIEAAVSLVPPRTR